MAKFNYRVQDPLGNFRSGTMEARDFKDARSIIEKRGFKVIELAPVSSGLGPPPPLEEPAPLEPKKAPLGPPPELPPEPIKEPTLVFTAPEVKPVGNIEILAKDSGSRYHSGPAPRRGYRPPIGERILSWLPSVQVSRAVAAVIAAIGLIWLVASWTQPESSSQIATPETQKFKLKVLGSVTVEGSTSLGDVEIRVDLPDIPYQQTFQWAKIDHPRAGHFVVEIEFESTRKAKQVILTARKPGIGQAVLPAQPVPPEGGELRGQKFHIPSLPR